MIEITQTLAIGAIFLIIGIAIVLGLGAAMFTYPKTTFTVMAGMFLACICWMLGTVVKLSLR